jgi:hypothetical protein
MPVLPTEAMPLDELRHTARIRADAAGMKARDAARKLMYACQDRDDERERLIDVLDLLDEMHRWKDNWASAHVDADRRERRAMDLAASCEHHGEIIDRLEGQVSHFERSANQADAARVALLGLVHALDEFVRVCRANERTGKTLPSGSAVVGWLERALGQARRAHDKAWRGKGKPK